MEGLKLKREQQTEIILYAWMLENGIKTYLNRQDTKIRELIPSYEIFKTNNPKRPDLLIYSQKLGWCAIEVKPNQKSNDIRSASKIQEYYEDYINGKTKYFINEEEIKISHFLIATNNSPYGGLFKTKDFPKNNTEDGKEWQKQLIAWNVIPPYEFIRTHDFIRQLWNNWEERDITAGLGILLSSSIDTKETFNKIGIPKALTQIYGQKQKKGKIINSWKQRWSEL